MSCETAPHYLLLTDEDLREQGRFKMNPPLRGREDREALGGILDGTIEVIATDHAPHTAGEKLRGLARSAMGIVGLECAFPLLYRYLVLPGTLSLERLVELMSVNPRRIFRGSRGARSRATRPTSRCSTLRRSTASIRRRSFRRGAPRPFDAWPVQSRVVRTVVGGREVFDTLHMNSNR